MEIYFNDLERKSVESIPICEMDKYFMEGYFYSVLINDGKIVGCEQ